MITTSLRGNVNYMLALSKLPGKAWGFGSHMNHEYPPSLSEYGKIRKTTAKSDFIHSQ